MWKEYIIPLKGKTLQNSRGDNKTINVDSSDIERLTSNGNKGTINIEGFEFAYNELIIKVKLQEIISISKLINAVHLALF